MYWETIRSISANGETRFCRAIAIPILQLIWPPKNPAHPPCRRERGCCAPFRRLLAQPARPDASASRPRRAVDPHRQAIAEHEIAQIAVTFAQGHAEVELKPAAPAQALIG